MKNRTMSEELIEKQKALEATQLFNSGKPRSISERLFEKDKMIKPEHMGTK